MASLFYGFKYISCYYSTKELADELADEYKFKYISCYYSTAKNNVPVKTEKHLNTSHVTIQLYKKTERYTNASTI